MGLSGRRVRKDSAYIPEKWLYDDYPFELKWAVVAGASHGLCEDFPAFQCAGGSRKTLIQQWQSVLPDKNREEILRHEVWHRGCRAVAEKVKAAMATYEQSRIAILSKCKRQP